MEKFDGISKWRHLIALDLQLDCWVVSQEVPALHSMEIESNGKGLCIEWKMRWNIMIQFDLLMCCSPIKTRLDQILFFTSKIDLAVDVSFSILVFDVFASK